MMNKPLFALVDCNNFFVSCEQVFRPDLAGHPCVVASSGDGCVVARSAEAKAIGIPMGAPIFKHRELFDKHNVKIFSANFELYGDISRRITEILTSITPRLEVYSIDESFLDISQLDIADYTQWARVVRQRIQQWVGVTVSIGIAPSKTLAKLASERAKKDPGNGGVALAGVVRGPTSHTMITDINIQHTLCERSDLSHMLAKTQVEDIWGIGRKMAPRLRARGLSTALDIASLSPLQGRQLLKSVHGERLVRELNGQSCLPLERIKLGAHMASATRTFGRDTSDLNVLEAAVASFAARSAHRLRTHNLRTRHVSVFLQSNRHRPNYQSAWRELALDQPTADTGTLTAAATQLVADAYQKGVPYHRAGVTLHHLEPNEGLQTDLLGHIDVTSHDRANRRMQALDRMNDKYGRRTLHFASEDLGRGWEPLKHHGSPRYTTNWDDLPKITIRS